MARCMVQTGNSAGLNVRASKSTSSTRLGVIPNGTYIDVTRCDGTWASFLYNGVPAFVQHTFLVSPPTQNGEGAAVGGKGTCNANSVNIRTTANGSVTGNMLNKGNVVDLYEESFVNSYWWYRIGASQWVRGDFFAPGVGTGTGSGGTGESSGNQNFVNGHLLNVTKNGTNLRKSPGGNRQCYVQTGTKFIISGSVNSGGYTWAKVIWGGSNATHMYIRSDCCEDMGFAPSSKVSAVVLLARSFANLGYTDDDLGIPSDPDRGGWCQLFLCFLCKAAGVSSSNYPSFSDALCSEGVNFFRNKGRFTQYSSGHLPTVGDWIYYSKGAQVYQHVGLVVSVNHTTGAIETIEGNMSSTVSHYSDVTSDSAHSQMIIYGFASPNYSA